MATIKRTYGKQQTTDILYNAQTKIVSFRIDLGWFGSTIFNLVPNQEGTYDVFKLYYDKNNQAQLARVGKTFKVTKQDGTVVEGLTKTTIGMRTQWDKELKKSIVTNEDCIIFTTHKLKESKKINDTTVKVGWVDFVIGTELPVQQEQPQQPKQDIPTVDINEDEIPF